MSDDDTLTMQALAILSRRMHAAERFCDARSVRSGSSLFFWRPNADMFFQVNSGHLSRHVVELNECFRLLSLAVYGGQGHPERHTLPQEFGITEFRHRALEPFPQNVPLAG